MSEGLGLMLEVVMQEAVMEEVVRMTIEVLEAVCVMLEEWYLAMVADYQDVL